MKEYKNCKSINEIYTYIQTLYNESIIPIESKKYMNNSFYRLLLKTKKRINKKYDNIEYFYKSQDPSYKFARRSPNFKNLNLTIIKYCGISAEIVKTYHNDTSKIKQKFIKKMIKTNEKIIEIFYIEKLIQENGIRIRIEVLPEAIFIEATQYIAKNNIITTSVQMVQKNEEIESYRTMDNFERNKYKLNEKDDFNLLMLLYEQILIVDSKYKIDILNYLLFGHEKKYEEEENNMCILLKDYYLISMNKNKNFSNVMDIKQE